MLFFSPIVWGILPQVQYGEYQVSIHLRWCALPSDGRFFQMVCSFELHFGKKDWSIWISQKNHRTTKTSPLKLALWWRWPGPAFFVCLQNQEFSLFGSTQREEFELFIILFAWISFRWHFTFYHGLITRTILKCFFERPWIAFLNWKVWKNQPQTVGSQLLNFQGKHIESVWISFVTSRLQTSKSYGGFSRKIRPPQRISGRC